MSPCITRRSVMKYIGEVAVTHGISQSWIILVQIRKCREWRSSSFASVIVSHSPHRSSDIIHRYGCLGQPPAGVSRHSRNLRAGERLPDAPQLPKFFRRREAAGKLHRKRLAGRVFRQQERIIYKLLFLLKNGGRGGIRTHDTGLPHTRFPSVRLHHSATRPRRRIMPKAVPRCNVESASVTLLLVRSAISRRGYPDGSPPTDRR